jgi:diguanylate cyclase (GGDEF)-like protein
MEAIFTGVTMILVDLVHNIALLIALAAIYQVISSRSGEARPVHLLLFGILFGLVGVVGMMTPIHYGEGVILDGRSIILSVAGLFGGPVVALISASIVSAYRLVLGGAGALLGSLVAFTSAFIGVAFYYLRLRADDRHLSAWQLLGIGMLVHLVMLAVLLYLPGEVGFHIVRDIGWIMLLVYPVAMMLVAMLFQDYEEKVSTGKTLHRLAYFDALTELPNRQFLIERLGASLRQSKSVNHSKVLLLINLDRFKTLNDARGHVAGDQLLQALALKLREHAGEGDVLARMSSDEFALLLNTQDANFRDVSLWGQHVADKVQVSIKYPIQLGEDEISMSSSIGIASFPVGAEDSAGNILRRADTAMHRAKQNGGNQSVVFQLAMASSVEEKYEIERELRKAIPAGELVLYLQSQVNDSGAVVGAEALVRWLHPRRGLVSPMTFIPVAEESDLIVEVGVWTLHEACRILAREEIFSQPLRLSVNISPRHFHYPGFVSSVKQTLAATGADPTHLTLEVTEGLLIQNVNDVIAKMTELAALGIHFSLDDFGTGYSSLSYLKRLPIHEIKIDKTFVQDAPDDPDDAALVESIIAVAQHMQLDVVAEGVETREQADFLNARAKVIHQGYLFHKPEPADLWVSRIKNGA